MLIGLAVSASTARAARADEPPAVAAEASAPGRSDKPFPTAAQPLGPTSDYQLMESNLVPVDRMTRTPDNWTGDIPSFGQPGWVDRRLEQQRSFLQPFLDSPVFPTVAARVSNIAGWNPRNSSGEADQYGYLSFYYLDIYAPFYTLRDSSPASTDHFRVTARLPAILSEHDVLSFFASAYIPTSGSWTATGGASTFLGYAHGADGFTFQVRAGFGYDELIGEVPIEAPLATSILYDAAIGYHLGRHVELIGQIDGRKWIAQTGATFRAFPGVRIFPLEQETFSLGISGMYWMDDYNPGGNGAMRTRRAGGFLDVGYLFI